MAKKTLSLAETLAKLKPLDDSWADAISDPATGLSLGINPFSLERDRLPDGSPSDYRVTVKTRQKPRVEISGPHETIFDAWRAMIDALEAWHEVKPVEQVYFIGTALIRGRTIKVGRSFNPESRLAQLQTGHGERLRIFATTPGGRWLEDSYHRRWRIRRTTGEWFTVGDCIVKEINRIRAEQGEKPL